MIVLEVNSSKLPLFFASLRTEVNVLVVEWSRIVRGDVREPRSFATRLLQIPQLGTKTELHVRIAMKRT